MSKNFHPYLEIEANLAADIGVLKSEIAVVLVVDKPMIHRDGILRHSKGC